MDYNKENSSNFLFRNAENCGQLASGKSDGKQRESAVRF